MFKNSKKFNAIKNYFKKLSLVLGRKEVGLLPNYLGFLILVSFIPILTLVLEVITLVLKSNHDLLTALNTALPANVYSYVQGLVMSKTSHIGLLTFTNISLLYITSQVYFAFYQSYMIIFDFKARQHFFKDRLMAILNTLLLIILILFMAFLTVFNHYLFEIIQSVFKNFIYLPFVYNLINLALSITVICVIVTFLMYSVPDVRQKLSDVFQGALFVTFGWIIVSFVFKIYVEKFANYSLYSSFATVIIFVTWIYLISQVLIIGIVINKVKKITTYETS